MIRDLVFPKHLLNHSLYHSFLELKKLHVLCCVPEDSLSPLINSRESCFSRWKDHNLSYVISKIYMNLPMTECKYIFWEWTVGKIYYTLNNLTIVINQNEDLHECLFLVAFWKVHVLCEHIFKHILVREWMLLVLWCGRSGQSTPECCSACCYHYL